MSEPYSLVLSRLGGDPRWFVLAGGKRWLRNELQAAYFRVLCEAARQATGRYLTRNQALTCCDHRGRALELLCTPVLGGRPFVHRRGDTCSAKKCIDSSPPWIEGFDFRVCGAAC